MNYLEQFVSEWYEYQGYFVRRNVNVGRRPSGGWECELDVVAFHPEKNRLVHIEPSMDADSWEVRERRYSKKFAAGRKYIPALFSGLQLPSQVEQIALLEFASKATRSELAGGKIMLVSELLQEVVAAVQNKRVAKAAISEQYPILRTVQFMCQYSPVSASRVKPELQT